jgi:hypothetical protein
LANIRDPVRGAATSVRQNAAAIIYVACRTRGASIEEFVAIGAAAEAWGVICTAAAVVDVVDGVGASAVTALGYIISTTTHDIV